MAHWAEINKNNIVIRVLVGDNNEPDEGQSFMESLGGTWIKTSYNAIAGKWRNPETNELTENPGFRKNFAGIGYTYDETRDAFISPKPEIEGKTFVLNEETCLWQEVSE